MGEKITGIKKYNLRCYSCGNTLDVDDDCKYHCSTCDKTFESEYAIVREYLRENGTAEASKISRITGVSMMKLNYYLRKGMVEIAEDSKVFIKCKKCGVDIKYGNYCPSCAKVLAPLAMKDENIQIDVGELAHMNRRSGSGMHYLEKYKERIKNN